MTEKLFRQLSLEDRAPVDLEQQISAGDYSDVEADDEYPSNGYFDDLPVRVVMDCCYMTVETNFIVDCIFLQQYTSVPTSDIHTQE